MKNKKKFFSQMLSLVLVAALLLGNVNLVTASASIEDRSTVYFGTQQDDVYGTKKAEWVTEGQEAKITMDITAKKIIGNVNRISKTDIVLVIDVSTSMRANNRIENVKSAAKDFVLGLLHGTNKKSVQVGLVTYGEEAITRAELTNEDGSLISEINKISILDDTGTNIQAGLRKANQMLLESKAVHLGNNEEVNQIIVLLSDGKPTYSYNATNFDVVKQWLVFDYSDIVGNGQDYEFYRYYVPYSTPITKTEKVIYLDGKYYNESGSDLTSINPTTVSLGNEKLNIVWRDYSGGKYDGWYSNSNKYPNIRFSDKFNDSNVIEEYSSGQYYKTYYGYINIPAYTATYMEYINNASDFFRISNHGVPTIHEAAAVKANGTTIYTIGYDISSDSSAEDVMLNVASVGKFKNASTTNAATSIEEILKSISKQVQEVIDTAQGATIVDQLPPWFTVNKTSLPTGADYDEASNTITWNLGDLKAPEGAEFVNKTLSFNIILDKSKLSAAAVATAGNLIAANLNCTLSYLDSKKVTKTVTTKDAPTATAVMANPLLPLATYDYTINYNIEGNGGSIPGSNTSDTRKAFLGDRIHLNSTLLSLGLLESQYQQPSVTGPVITDSGNTYLLIGNVSQDNTATVTAKLNRYTVIFYKNELNSATNESFETRNDVVYGTGVAKPSTNPTKEQDNVNTYPFSNWSIGDAQLVNVTSNLNVYPYFSSNQRLYTVAFYQDETATEPLYFYLVPFGLNEIVAPPSPLAPSNANPDNNYTFIGWDKAWNNITVPGDIRVNATYRSEIKVSDVYFYDVAGNLINKEPQKVNYGSDAVAPNAETFVTIAVDQVNSNLVRVFNGTWSTPFTAVRTPVLHVKANYDLKDRYYTVRYFATTDAAEPIYTADVEYKHESIYGGDTPVKVDTDNRYTYTFAGAWSLKSTEPASNYLKEVTKDLDVYADYSQTENTFTFTFYYWDENGDPTNYVYQNITWGSSVTPPTVATVSGAGVVKEFKSWTGESYQNIKKNGSATASEVMSYEVTFIYGGNKSETQLVVENGNATPPGNLDYQDEKDIYTFINWDKPYSNITEATTITANYSVIPREFKVVFINSVTEEVIGEIHTGLHYDDIVTVPIPETFNDNQTTYTFSHWSEPIGSQVTVKGNAIYLAYYEAKPNVYKVNFVDVTMTDDSEAVTAKNTVLWDASILHNGNAAADAAMASSMIQVSDLNTKKYQYMFANWVTAPGGTQVADLTSITADTTVFASYTREWVEYTVIFKDDVAHGSVIFPVTIDGNTVDQQTVPYGGTAIEPVFMMDENTNSTEYGQPYWNSNAWKDVMMNSQSDENGVIIITLYRPSSPARHEVEFYSEDGKQKFTNNTETGKYIFTYGDKITSKPADQVKESTNTQHFTFAGWGTEPNSAGSLVDFDTFTVSESGIKLYAQFKATVRYYTVTFLDENGNKFPSSEIPYQVMVEYGYPALGDGRTAAEERAVEYANYSSTINTTVTFRGWSLISKANGQEITDLSKITKDITVFAMNEDSTNKHTLTYYSDEYTTVPNPIFATDIVTGGAIISFTPTDQENSYVIRQTGPSKTSVDRLFAFDHWRVFVKDGDDYYELFTKESEPEVNYFAAKLQEEVRLNSDLYLFPVYESSIKTFTVNFVDFDGKVLKTEAGIKYNKTATAPANPSRSDVYTSTSRTIYTFAGWDKDFSKVLADTTVTAVYNEVTYSNTTPDPIIIPTVAQTVEEVADVIEEIPQGTPEIPQGSPVVEEEVDPLPVDDTSEEVFDVAIEAIPEGTPELPQTGTAPVGIFYGLGIACALIGASIIILGRKKNEEEF